MLSCSETALFSLSKFTIRSYGYSKDKGKRTTYRLLSKPKDLLVTILMLNILANILVQNTFSNIFGNFQSFFLKVGIPLVIILLFGEVIPKSIAIANNKKISALVSPVIFFISKVLGPIRIFFTFITSYISRVLFFFLKKEPPTSAEELKHIIESSKETGILNRDETRLVSGYLELTGVLVKEKMSPKDEVLFYNANDSLLKLVDLFMESKLSKIPVCEGSLDRILGIISVKKFFFNKENIKDKSSLLKLLKKPFFIPETTNARDLLEDFRKNRESLAIVVDEYGMVKGVISKEDLVEEVIGEVSDLRDVQEFYTKYSEDTIIANGKLEISIFEDIFSVKLKSETRQVTIGGFLIEKLERIPKAGDKFSTKEFLFYVLEADPNRVKKIYIRKLEER
jgi:CBS domain containing-hemolysin-like protein